MESIFHDGFLEIGKQLAIPEETIIEYKIDVLVEQGSNSSVRYKYDDEKHALVCDQILDYPFKSHFNFGIIPNTSNTYNGTLDVIIIMENSLMPGSYINCKLIGCCEIKNNHTAKKPYLIMCPTEHLDYTFRECNNIIHLDKTILNKIQYMLLYRHSLCYSGCVNDLSLEFKDKRHGIKLYENAVKRYNDLM